MLKVQPDGPATCCPELVGCCALAPHIPPTASSVVRTPATTIRFNIRNSLAATASAQYDLILSSAKSTNPPIGFVTHREWTVNLYPVIAVRSMIEVLPPPGGQREQS